ncbi:MAG: protein kinase domain-containing protein, partial [Aggregatilineales bacterium]
MPLDNDATRPMQRRFGPYVCGKLMGMSPNSAVYIAHHQEQADAKVILRVMTVVQHDVQAAIAECKDELMAFAALENPYIVPILDYGADKSVIYIATRLMAGASLADRLKKRASRDILPAPDEIVNMGRTLAEALDYIHDAGMIHGQVEPHNILFDEDGVAYLSDIGLTRLLKIIFRLDASNSFTTSPYSAPELWDGLRPQPETDLYAVACI